jgi:hypothetical protein
MVSAAMRALGVTGARRQNRCRWASVMVLLLCFVGLGRVGRVRRGRRRRVLTEKGDSRTYPLWKVVIVDEGWRDSTKGLKGPRGAESNDRFSQAFLSTLFF